MPSYDNLQYDVSEGRGEIVLNRPDVMNAYNDEMLREIDECVEVVMSDDDVRVVILTGRGQAFCSGVDLNRTTNHAQTKRMFENHRAKVDAIYRGLYKGSKPTIAAVNGPAIGAGFGFAACCDLRLMAEDAFLRDQHLNVGLAPSVGAGWLLPRLIGESTAKEIVLTAEDISANRAEEFGLVRCVVDSGETMRAARDLANELATKPPIAVRGALEMMNTEQSFEEYVRSTVEWQWRCKQSSDHCDAVSRVQEDDADVRFFEASTSEE